MKYRLGIVGFLLAAILPAAASAQGNAADSLAVAQTGRAYHAALASGDSTAALALLAPDAVILESGSVESRSEYRSHHLSADIEFASAVPGIRGEITVTVSDGIAWASSTSTTEGTFRDRAIMSSGAELMVLSRTPAGWTVRAIHWSSRNRR